MGTAYPFRCYIDTTRLAAAAILAGFSSEQQKGLDVTDVTGRKWTALRPCTVAVACVLGESSGDAWSINTGNKDGSEDYGATQINGKAHADLLSDPLHVSPYRFVDALALAHAVYVNAGEQFTPWNAFKPNPSLNGFPSMAWWYDETRALTRLRYASDGVAAARARLSSGETFQQVVRIDLRDFTPYPKVKP